MNNFSTKIFEDAYNKAKMEGQKFSGEARIRRIIAYSLKALAVFGGIALATGLNEKEAQVIGIMIAVVIAVDELSSNHRRLLIITRAAKAYKSLFDKVEFEYNNQLSPIIRLKDEGNEEGAIKKLDNLNRKFSTIIYDNTSKLKNSVIEADLKFLENIALDDNKENILLK